MRLGGGCRGRFGLSWMESNRSGTVTAAAPCPAAVIRPSTHQNGLTSEGHDARA